MPPPFTVPGLLHGTWLPSRLGFTHGPGHLSRAPQKPRAPTLQRQHFGRVHDAARTAAWPAFAGTFPLAFLAAGAAMRAKCHGRCPKALLGALGRRARAPPGATRVSVKGKFYGRSKGALKKWGGGGFIAKQDGTALREESLLRRSMRDGPLKWTPKRELWPGYVTDDQEGFGMLRPGNEVDVLLEKSRHPEVRSNQEWMEGVVIAVDEDTNRVAVCLSSDDGTVDVPYGLGFLSRAEDARELCSASELERISRHRVRGEAHALFKYAGGLSTAARSQAVLTLSRMGEVQLAHRLISEHNSVVSSIAMRELAHAHALGGDITAALYHLDDLWPPAAAQLLVEVLALALTMRIQSERMRLGVDFLRGVESNPAVSEVVEAICEALPQLGTYAAAVRGQPPLISREGLTEAFNELLQSCGRAHAVPVAFRVLEWMEALAVPKNAFTYEAIGLNVVKRVGLLRKVWDLPNAPEETVPEIVFAGRSNVGKSSLVNMLLGRTALAPTSSRPGKTKTMDFFDVNAGHPALPRFRLVDVPGLGFARASKDMRQRWVSLIGGYFVQRKSLKVVFHLLDAGLCEIMPADRDLWKLLAQAKRTDYELCIALTKADNSLPSQMERFAKVVREALRVQGSDLALNATIFACSARSKLGKDTLWRKIWSAVGVGDSSIVQGPAYRPRRIEEYADEHERLELDHREQSAPEATRPRILEVLA
uniref:EngB-type G domain-containing protein n=1 Tax=Pyrodinium bahamense TaxID=73915 RepID=A0A7S0AUD9_9DINO|mmetsp:Transcript_40884/g.113675  ORF Transcript_40884/g.113675 Transcript_40884/m.113675 type:complete len:708 (+) Transcript_40884:54-2177(+)